MSTPPPHPSSTEATYEVLLRNTVNAAWTGAGTALAVNGSVVMPQTPTGSMIFGYFNMAALNNAGEVVLTSGGSQPVSLPAPALARLPGIVVNNWAGNNLGATNVSANAATPIWVSAYGPGIPGQVPGKLTIGTALSLGTTQAAQGATNPQSMMLVMTVASSALGIFAVIGGPTDAGGNNGYVFAVNAAADTGPGTGQTPPAGYYATAVGNSCSLSFNWQGATLYVANMSASTVVGQVLLRAL
ncbi:MAG TPA: hypothetical protein VE913_21490 [Longimicrobium sp.]|nr:hypothetical protein [Longimicrobium sp.]